MGFALESNQVLEVAVLGEYEDQDAVNIFHYLTGTIAGDVDSNEWLNEFRLAWRAAWCAFADDDYDIIAYTVREVTGITGTTTANAQLVYGASSMISGTTSDKGQVAGAGLPSFVTATARKFTGGGATTTYFEDNPPDPVGIERAFRGRSGMPALPEASTVSGDGNFIDDGVLAAANSALVALIEIEYTEGLNGIDALMQVVSLSRNGLVRIDAGLEPTFALQEVIDFQLNNYVGSQMSRKYGGPG